MTDESNVQQTGESSKPQQSMHSKGTTEERRAWAINAAKARWKATHSPLITPATATQEILDLGRDMSVAEAKALTPEQKRIRSNIRKAAWWRRRYHAEKNGTAPQSAVTRGKVKLPQPMPVARRMEPSEVPVEFQHMFSAEELDLMRHMSMGEGAKLKRDNPKAYKLRSRLKSRLWYQIHRGAIRQRQRRYEERKREKRGLMLQPQVATQPVAQPQQEVAVPAVQQAEPCKLSECPHCHSRFYIVKGQTTE